MTHIDCHQSQDSTLNAGQNLSITATGKNKDSNPDSGNITVIGSELKAGKDLSLSATQDINLVSAQNTEQTTRQNSSKGSSVGVGVGVGAGGPIGDQLFTNAAGWHGFITKLEYKAAEKGVHLVKLDQWFASSKTCHCCGHKMSEMPLHKRIWHCPECGVEHDRDINAAINIRHKGILELQAAGLVVSAHGDQRKSVVQMVAV